MIKCQNFLSEYFPFLVVKISMYLNMLNRRVFVMTFETTIPVTQGWNILVYEPTSLHL